ncbi:MarR family winged helix-turn-helix transcriptional regulator [Bacillus cytotoxicus]|uniref:Transcriptional regulator, MarR family n=1 Tax=Bacillus cytotoxicus (strain DSM 22905 / CIP 110041 / 391-98 / NVH 391-98) TaxID=315749 RepID=A7GNL8_BACCN|nr:MULTISPECIES: MarR family transcriptional regulator [Bacillus cereus group]ABS21726.1 transcriptional regulator, MarR family [Bacillus cytotoxicus NVH 391-98]AWC28340.1 MarR family transcriptional regulator [Bacillus cytotoxicus]AWC32372.1 MarR family transcriptional regulator [Bacillus cytotoxicus]AWC36401.1 MarR family transcriptional regulator [Bacillus cytotoxicus]AWC40275.1 MarR family transcriptional regulator [Bacillus cytotoxicus]
MKHINQNWETIYYHLRCEYENNLSHQAIRILQITSREAETTISKIASELNLSHNTASEHVKRLIQKDLILKERNKKDERVVNLALTAKGKEALIKHTLLDEKKLKILESQLSKEEQQIIEQAFSILAKEAQYAFPR